MEKGGPCHTFGWRQRFLPESSTSMLMFHSESGQPMSRTSILHYPIPNFIVALSAPMLKTLPPSLLLIPSWTCILLDYIPGFCFSVLYSFYRAAYRPARMHMEKLKWIRYNFLWSFLWKRGGTGCFKRRVRKLKLRVVGPCFLLKMQHTGCLPLYETLLF